MQNSRARLVGWWCTLMAGCAGACAGFSFAQSYPSRPIRLVVPFGPGGATDQTARILSPRLVEQLGVPLVIDLRPGASAMIGTNIVAKAIPDGYTLALVASEFSINPSLQPNIPYDTLTDFAPVSEVASNMFVLSAHPSVPAKSVKELIELARARPGQLTYGSTGGGSITNLAAQLFQKATRTKLVHVPYKGGGPATIALLSNEVNIMFSGTGSAVGYIKSGRMRAIAVTGSHRFAEIPEVPTFREAGLPELELTSWFGLLAPRGTPSAIVTKLNTEIVAALQHPTVKERLNALGIEPVGSAPGDFARFIRAEVKKWTELVTSSATRAD